jgi:hypothetical protein
MLPTITLHGEFESSVIPYSGQTVMFVLFSLMKFESRIAGDFIILGCYSALISFSN